MKVECLDAVIRIKFYQYFLILDINEEELYINGNKINKNKPIRTYNKSYVKGNTIKYPKKTIAQLIVNKEVLVVDYSDSNKFYFRYWKSLKEFHTWRHEATDTYMFKKDHDTGNKVLYRNIFEIPINIWETNKEPQEKVTIYETNST